MSKPGITKVVGEVTESLPNAYFKVLIGDSLSIEILAYLGGKMRLHSINLIVGDKVEVEMSIHDLTKGRIVRRLKDKDR